MNRGIRNITIKGFKSFREVVDFKLNDLNIIIGANGAGKSNFIQIFHMLSAMINNRFSDYIRSNGGADSFLFNGPKETMGRKKRSEGRADLWKQFPAFVPAAEPRL